MHDHVATTSEAQNGPGEVPETQDAPEVVMADLLIEEVSIDGMCGVY
jgi:mycofactocin precursor